MPQPQDNPKPGLILEQNPMRSTQGRMRKNRLFQSLCLAATLLAILILVVLLLSIFFQGVGGLNLDFLTQGNSSDPDKAGISVSLIGTIAIVAICGLSAIPLGVGTALLIEEFRPKHKTLRRLHSIVEVNIRNLAGVPSIVYGILGATAFAMMFGLFGPMGESNLAIGQQWYDLYQTEDKQVYYTPRDGSLEHDPEIVPADPQMALYRTGDLSEEATDLNWMTEEDVQPVRDQIYNELGAFESALRAAVKAQRPSRRGAPEITREQAQRIADTAIQAGTWQSDPEKLRPKLVDAIAALDGLGFRELIKGQNEAIALGVDAEYATRVPNTMMVGKRPVRVDHKAWYHLALPFGRGVLAGGLTLMLVILPIIIVASQEALRAVPASYRQGSLALGSTHWQAISKTALPAAIPGICTGTILAISRAIGEAAPILVLGGTGYVTSSPQNLMDRFAALPMTIYYWSGLPNPDFRTIAASGIIVLLVALLSFNALAIYIRHRSGRHQA